MLLGPPPLQQQPWLAKADHLGPGLRRAMGGNPLENDQRSHWSKTHCAGVQNRTVWFVSSIQEGRPLGRYKAQIMARQHESRYNRGYMPAPATTDAQTTMHHIHKQAATRNYRHCSGVCAHAYSNATLLLGKGRPKRLNKQPKKATSADFSGGRPHTPHSTSNSVMAHTHSIAAP